MANAEPAHDQSRIRATEIRILVERVIAQGAQPESVLRQLDAGPGGPNLAPLALLGEKRFLAPCLRGFVGYRADIDEGRERGAASMQRFLRSAQV